MTKSGVVYTNPRNSFDTIRVMNGEPRSPHAVLQKPYVVDQIAGEFLMLDGSRVEACDSAAMYLPLETYTFTKRGETAVTQTVTSLRWALIVGSVIRRIADRDYQLRAWFNRGPEVSSPTELICQLRSDFSFARGAQEDWTALSLDQRAAALGLAVRIDEIDKKYDGQLDPAAVSDDPDWGQVRILARRVLELLPIQTR